MKNQGTYERLRARIVAWARTEEGRDSVWVRHVLLLPDLFHLLCGLALDPDVPAKHKAAVGTALAYVVLPYDLIPEGVFGPAGFTDDVALAAYVLNGILNHVDPKIVLRHWKGDQDLLRQIRNILDAADRMLGTGLWAKLRQAVASR